MMYKWLWYKISGRPHKVKVDKLIDDLDSDTKDYKKLNKFLIVKIDMYGKTWVSYTSYLDLKEDYELAQLSKKVMGQIVKFYEPNGNK